MTVKWYKKLSLIKSRGQQMHLQFLLKGPERQTIQNFSSRGFTMFLLHFRMLDGRLLDCYSTD